MVDLTPPAFHDGVGVGDGGEQRGDEPHAHGDVPDGEAEALDAGAVEDEDAEDAGEPDDGGFGDEVVGFEAGAENPVGEGVVGWPDVVGGGQDGPSSNEVEEDRVADGQPAEEEKAVECVLQELSQEVVHA